MPWLIVLVVVVEMEGVWSGVEVYVLSVAEWQDERC